MATAPASGDAFRRQVTFRLGAADATLLEAAAQAHGGIQAGIIAALRAYGAQLAQARLPAPTPPLEEPAPPPAPAALPAPPTPRPSSQGQEEERVVELNVAEAAPVLGLSASALRERIKRGSHSGRRSEKGYYLAEIPVADLLAQDVALSPSGAAQALGLRASTITRHCKQGRYPNAAHDGAGWTIPASDLL